MGFGIDGGCGKDCGFVGWRKTMPMIIYKKRFDFILV